MVMVHGQTTKEIVILVNGSRIWLMVMECINGRTVTDTKANG